MVNEELPTRIRCVLRNEGYTDLREFFFDHLYTWHDVPNLGRKTMKEIARILGFGHAYSPYHDTKAHPVFIMYLYKDGVISAEKAMTMLMRLERFELKHRYELLFADL